MRILLPSITVATGFGLIQDYSTIRRQSYNYGTTSHTTLHQSTPSKPKKLDVISLKDGGDKYECYGDSKTNEFEVVSSEYSTTYHSPVMWKECIDALLGCSRSATRNNNNEDNEFLHPLIFVDGTLGGGGHSAALLKYLCPGDIVFGCDVDPEALQTARTRLEQYLGDDDAKPLFVPVQSNFCDLESNLATIIDPKTQDPYIKNGIDGILLDLGVSSHQIDTPERGFAFMKDGPLDMRMGMENTGGLTAADICNEFDAAELQRLLSHYGDEPRAKTIAATIVKNRPFSTTGQLADAIAQVTPAFAKHKRMGRTATLARVFQSLRIVVNQEDRVLEKALTETCPSLLRPGGRLVVLSYHSMEDRAAKRVIRDGSIKKSKQNDARDIYGNYIGPPKPFRPVGKAKTASKEEVEVNSRARSATLRVGERQ